MLVHSKGTQYKAGPKNESANATVSVDADSGAQLQKSWSLAPLEMNMTLKSLQHKSAKFNNRYCNAILCSTTVEFLKEPASRPTPIYKNLVFLLEPTNCFIFKVSIMRTVFKWSQCFIKIMMPVSVTRSSKPKNIHL